MYFSKILKKLREKYRLTYSGLSKLTKMAPSYIKYLEDGKRGLPKDEYVEKLGTAFTSVKNEHGYYFPYFEFTPALVQAVQFERTQELHQSFIWKIIQHILIKNYHLLSSSEQDSESKKVLDLLIALTKVRAFQKTQEEFKISFEKGLKDFEIKLSELIGDLIQRDGFQQLSSLNYFINGIQMDISKPKITIVFKHEWLQEQYDKMYAHLSLDSIWRYL